MQTIWMKIELIRSLLLKVYLPRKRISSSCNYTFLYSIYTVYIFKNSHTVTCFMHHPNISCYAFSAVIRPRSCAISPHNCTFLYLRGAGQLIRSYVAELVVSKKTVLRPRQKIIVRAMRARALMPVLAGSRAGRSAKRKCDFEGKMSEPIWFALEGKVAGDVARDTKITVASINTCKNRQRGTRGRRINTNFQYSRTTSLAYFARRPRNLLRVHVYMCMCVCVLSPSTPAPKKRLRGQVIETCEALDLTACVSLQCAASLFFRIVMAALINALLYSSDENRG